MKILSAKPIQDGTVVEIETDDKGDFKYIWLDAKYLKDIAYMVEKW
jgi:hypothetical protein